MISPELLRRYPWFSGLSESALKAIALMSEECDVQAGQVLFEEGDTAKHLMLVVEGSVDIAFQGEEGQRFIVDTVVAGQPFCWSSQVEPFEETASGVVRESGKLICIDGQKLRELCEADYQVGYRVMHQIAKVLRHRLQGARLQLIATAAKTVP